MKGWRANAMPVGATDGTYNAEGERYPTYKATCACPTCGQAMLRSKVTLAALLDIQCGWVSEAIIAKLVADYPKRVGTEDMTWFVWQGKDEPDASRTVLSVAVHRLRKRLKAYGWTIPAAKGGPGGGGWQLKPL